MVVVRFLVLIVVIFVSILMIRYREWLVRQIGKSGWAEHYLGAGGTYTMWILIALLFIILAMFWAFGAPGQKPI